MFDGYGGPPVFQRMYILGTQWSHTQVMRWDTNIRYIGDVTEADGMLLDAQKDAHEKSPLDLENIRSMQSMQSKIKSIYYL